MSDKLQNIKAVNELLAGNHKSQTRKSIYTGSTKTVIPEDEVIERFKTGKPKIWIETDPKGFRTRVTQHDGFKSREPENSVLKTVQDALAVPDECPKCGTKMRNHEKRLNFKFWFKRKSCFSCVLKESMKETVWGNADGELGEVDISSQVERVETDYNKLKETIRNQFAENTNGKE